MDSISLCSNFLKCLTLMQEAVWGDCQSQQWCNDIISPPQVTHILSWARGALSITIIYRCPAEPSCIGIWAGMSMFMLLIPTSILHVFGSRLVAVVGCDIALHRNFKIICWAWWFWINCDLFFESRISLSCISPFLVSSSFCLDSSCKWLLQMHMFQ